MTVPVALPPARTRGREAALPSGAGVPGRRPALHRRVRQVGTAAVLGVLALSVVAPGPVTAAAPAVAVTGVLLGLPHGAVDHLTPAWAGRRLRQPAFAALLLAYVAVVLAGALALHLAPAPTLVAFLAASAWHFGRGEVVEAAQAQGRRVPSPRSDLLPTVAHGLVVTVLPIAAWPAVSLPLLAVLAPEFGRVPPAVPAAVGALTAVLVAAALVRLVSQQRTGEAFELALLAVTFWVVHPFAAFGVYFGLWHSLRHGARLVELAAGDGPLRRGLRRVGVQAALPTLGALAFLSMVVLTARLAPAPAASGLLAAELATLVGLTFPHAVVVAWLDRSLAGSEPG